VVTAVAVLVVAALVSVSCGGSGPTDSGGSRQESGSPKSTGVAGVADAATRAVPADCGPTPEPVELTARVISTTSHDPEAFTEGFVMVGDSLYESTGLEGRSSVRRVDPTTGTVLRTTDLPADLFGEGLTTVGDERLVQLTWTEGRAIVWDRGTLTKVGEHRYTGEGWGITTLDGGDLIMSDGSNRLTIRDPSDFSVLGAWEVDRKGGPADQLNELEWDGEHLWANRWKTDEIVRIDLRCHRVDGVLDASRLRDRAAADAAPGHPIDVLNGIAHVPGTDEMLVTGKFWPTTFRVRIDAA
jgi:glutaminyl-peptide cyclotransferase